MPEREWILLNPGPANTSRSVRGALVMPDLCHREPEFFEMMRECRERLVRLSDCAERFAAVLFTGSGTAAVEAAVCSAVPKDRTLLIVPSVASSVPASTCCTFKGFHWPLAVLRLIWI